MEAWNESCDYLREFFNKRPCYVKEYLTERFNSEVLEKFDCTFLLEKTYASMDVFPNPNSGNFTLIVKDGDFSNGEMDILNSIGQTVYSEQVNTRIQEFDLQFLTNGIYHVVLHTPEKTHTKKIVVMK